MIIPNKTSFSIYTFFSPNHIMLEAAKPGSKLALSGLRSTIETPLAGGDMGYVSHKPGP